VYESNPKPSYAIVNQLIWREFFYVMATNNPFYGEIGNDYNFHEISFFLALLLFMVL
jgi:hypothetical protein